VHVSDLHRAPTSHSKTSWCAAMGVISSFIIVARTWIINASVSACDYRMPTGG